MEISTTLTLLLLLQGVTSSHTALTVVDMTFELGNDTVYWPGNPPFGFDMLFRGNSSSGYWYESNTFFTPEHGGTHVDAPSHFYKGSWRAEEIPAGRLVGPAVVVDVKASAAVDPDYLLTVSDIQAWERQHGKMPEKAIVMMNSGWGSRYPNASQVFNTDTPTVPATFHFPGIHPDAATFLATRSDVIAVGVDTPSTDYGQSTTFNTHVILGRHNVLGLENVANLDQLPARGATVVIGMVKLRDGSGGPARLLAIVGDRDPFHPDSGTGRACRTTSVSLWVLVGLLVCVLVVAGPR